MAINAYFKSNNPIEKQISNLAFSEFEIEGRVCHSLEGFYQGIKRSGIEIQDYRLSRTRKPTSLGVG